MIYFLRDLFGILTTGHSGGTSGDNLKVVTVIHVRDDDARDSAIELEVRRVRFWMSEVRTRKFAGKFVERRGASTVLDLTGRKD